MTKTDSSKSPQPSLPWIQFRHKEFANISILLFLFVIYNKIDVKLKQLFGAAQVALVNKILMVTTKKRSKYNVEKQSTSPKQEEHICSYANSYAKSCYV